MTACSNRKGRAGRVITAALVGALSVGAPAVALAANGGVEMMTADQAADYSAGTIGITSASGTGTQKDPFVFTALSDGSALDINVASVKTATGATVAVDSDCKVAFQQLDENGAVTGSELEEIVAPGNYVLTVEAIDGYYKGGKATAYIKVKPAVLGKLTAYEVDPDDVSDLGDTGFMFTGSTLNVGFKNSVSLKEGTDYTVKILKAGTDNVSQAPAVEVKDAGNYTAYVTGIGQYKGQTAEVDFTVNEFNFSAADITVDDVIASDVAPTHPTKVVIADGHPGFSGTELDPSLVNISLESGLFNDCKQYDFVATYDKDNANLTESLDPSKDGRIGTVKVNKVENAATFVYDGKAIESSYSFNKAKGEKFDPSKLEAYNGDAKIGKSFSYEVVNAVNGHEAKDQLDGNIAGTYVVTAKVDAETSGWKVAGTCTFTVRIAIDSVDADASVFVYSKADNKTVTSVSKAYDGAAIEVDHYGVKAFDAQGKEIKDSTLKLVMVDSEGKSVTTAVDAGEYTIKVVSDKLDLTGTTELPVTISKVDLSELRVGGLVTKAGGSYLPALGTAYNWAQLGLQYNTHELDADGNEVWAALDTSWATKVDFERYDSEKGEWVKDNSNLGKVEGSWRAVLRGSATDAKNYDFATDDNETVVEFKCVKASKLVYEDVNPEKWYVDPVFEAKQQEYLTGYSGTKLFGPEDTITRGQVACVLFNMAGGEYGSDGDFHYTEGFGYDTGFSDVDGTKYYGKAIAWAHASGVVNGSDGEFRPDDAVTREEFVAMLANYAELKGEDVEGAEADLSAFADASEVSGWAAESVEWAVSQKVMGNGGYIGARSTITRAEAAAMAVNYQPVKLVKDTH